MSDQKTHHRPRLRRIGATLAAAVLLAGAGGGLASGQAGDDFITGSGISQAQILRVGPTAGRLSLAPTVGLSLADYLGTVGRGEARAADWAALGVAEPGLDENTPSVRIASTDEGSEEGVHEFVAGQTESGNGGGFMELFARATDAPLGESRFRLESFAIPGLFEVHGGEAYTSSGIVSEGIRESFSSVRIGRLDLGGGSAVLEGLHWEAVQRTGGGGQTVTGSFTVQSASAGGEPLPVPVGGGDLESVLGPLNDALAQTGFAIKPPEVRTSGDVARVTPLAIQIVDSPFGREFVGPVLDAIQPAREPLTDALIEIAKQIHEGSDEEVPDLTVAVLVADLTLGIISGSSQLHIDLGGVSAFTEGERFENPLAGLAVPPPFEGGGVETILEPGTPGIPAVPGAPGAQPDTAELVVSAPPQTRDVPGDRGGLAVLVGLIGLGVAGALAAGDWYRMRRGAAGA